MSETVAHEEIVNANCHVQFCIRFIVMKRFFDIFVSLTPLLFFTPIFFLTALLVQLKLGSPILLRRHRPGKNADSFEMMEFRSMLDFVRNYGNPLLGEERLTRFGKFLKESSQNEVRGLWNFLKGEMSLVCPRPLLVKYLPFYSEEQAHRHEVRPGITGLA